MAAFGVFVRIIIVNSARTSVDASSAMKGGIPSVDVVILIAFAKKGLLAVSHVTIVTIDDSAALTFVLSVLTVRRNKGVMSRSLFLLFVCHLTYEHITSTFLTHPDVAGL